MTRPGEMQGGAARDVRAALRTRAPHVRATQGKTPAGPSHPARGGLGQVRLQAEGRGLADGQGHARRSSPIMAETSEDAKLGVEEKWEFIKVRIWGLMLEGPF